LGSSYVISFVVGLYLKGKLPVMGRSSLIEDIYNEFISGPFNTAPEVLIITLPEGWFNVPAFCPIAIQLSP
jgi:hypothetical protein